MLAELVQVIVFGTMALLGLRGPAWWLAVGWTLHPLWDVVLRYLGPGCSFAPTTYTIPCLSFDLLLPPTPLLQCGLVGGRRLGFRGVAT